MPLAILYLISLAIIGKVTVGNYHNDGAPCTWLVIIECLKQNIEANCLTVIPFSDKVPYLATFRRRPSGSGLTA